jgi:hypothetical protein
VSRRFVLSFELAVGLLAAIAGLMLAYTTVTLVTIGGHAGEPEWVRLGGQLLMGAASVGLTVGAASMLRIFWAAFAEDAVCLD